MFVGWQGVLWHKAARLLGTIMLMESIFNTANNVFNPIQVSNRRAPSQLNSQYDFIIVGGGTAGCIMASRLSEHFQVLLVETGGEQPKHSLIPWFHLWLPNSPIDYKYSTEPSLHGALKGFDNARAWMWRGRVLGGTHSINTMIHMRGHAKDYDNWKENFGLHNWDHNHVDKVIDNLINMEEDEDNPNPENNKEIFDKRLSVGYARHKTKMQQAFLDAGRELGYSVGEHNSGHEFEFGKILFNIKNGQRQTTFQAFIDENNQNLHLALFSRVEFIHIRDKRARGVRIRDLNTNEIFNIKAKYEVILSAGAVGSPQLLMLSGIGPKSHLKSLNIQLKHHLEGVGRNLHDHVAAYGLTWKVEKGAAYNPFLYTADFRTVLDYKLFNEGPLAAPVGVEANAFVASSESTLNWPDLQLTMLSTHPGFDGGTVYREFLGIKKDFFDAYFLKNAFQEGFSIYPILSRPKSRGRIMLRSNNIDDSPSIQPNYLSHSDDIKVLIEGLKIAKKIGDAHAFKVFNATFHSQPLPGCENEIGDDYWRCWVMTLATTDHHPVGSCRMGNDTDNLAVLDESFRVRGVLGLRVVDASAMPQIVSANINSPVAMMAERAANFVRKQYELNNDIL